MYEPILEWKTTEEYLIEIAKRFKEARKALKVTQKRLAVISGVSYASIRRFENTGEISLHSLVDIAVALNYKDDINNLFSKVRYTNIEDAMKK